MLIKNISNIVNNKIDCNMLNNSNYISTENMLENFGGIKDASNVPSGKCTAILTDDILLSNIRPYFKKLWFSKLDGGCSNDVIALRVNNKLALSKYVFYALSSNKFFDVYVANCKGTKMPRGNKDVLLNYDIPTKSLSEQQHIVDTIGSVDDLIENIEEKSQRVKKHGNKLFSKIRLNNLESLLNKVSFSKGKEIGSLNYLDKQIDDSVPYIRVGDLLGGSFDTFTTSKNVPLCNEEDILITFDGAPGRNNYGLKGAISSGIQKVVCKQKIKGFIYFYINSDLCQNTIQSNAQGTTILLASKAIKELKIPVIEDDNVYQKFNDLFSYLIVLSKEKTVLQKQKQLLLQKYFGPPEKT